MVLPLLFAGTPEVAVPSLRLLAEDHEHFDVRAVLTRPDAPTGRGRKLVQSPVKQAALELGLPVWQSDPSEEELFIKQLKDSGIKAAAVVAYGKILREPVLNALPLGWYNLHFSLLPQWRGAAPVQRSIGLEMMLLERQYFVLLKVWILVLFFLNTLLKSDLMKLLEIC